MVKAKAESQKCCTTSEHLALPDVAWAEELAKLSWAVAHPARVRIVRLLLNRNSCMCCSTRICGPDVDPVLPHFAADLDWLKGQGHNVERYNLAQQPQAFIENKAIHQVLSTEGTDALPVVVIDGEIVSRKVYPTRDSLTALVSGSPTKQLLPVTKASGGCCGTSGCC